MSHNDLLSRLRTANAIEARAIWNEAREREVTDALERAYRFGRVLSGGSEGDTVSAR